MHQRALQFEAIGTQWSLMVQDELDEAAWSSLTQSIYERIQKFDKHYSRFRSDSLVTAMSRDAGIYQLPADAYPLLTVYEQLYRATDGKVTPLIGQSIADAGYDANYSLQPKTLQQPPSWDDVIHYDKNTITLSQPALLDFGAAGKGYLVDIVSDIIREANISNYTLNASGDILHRTTHDQPLEIGLENPFDTSEVIGTTRITNQSLCASAGSKRAWSTFTHILDPVSLQSPTSIAATWVIANTTLLADGLATALFFTDPARLTEAFSFSYAILGADGQLTHDQHFPVTLFTAEADTYAAH